MSSVVSSRFPVPVRILSILLLALQFSCKKDQVLPVDPKYPTTYSTIHPDSLLQERINFHAKYPYIFTGIDELGFFGYDSFPEVSPPKGPSLTQEEAAEIAFSFLTGNPGPSGITNQNFRFESVVHKPENFGNDHWHFEISDQFIDTIEVISTGMSLKVMNGEIFMCNGHWYPDIYIPPVFNFDLEKAKAQLVNHIVTYFDLISEKHHKLSIEDIQQVRGIRLLIVPVKEATSIEMHIVWEIKTGIFFAMVDVMSGQVVSDGTTVIF